MNTAEKRMIVHTERRVAALEGQVHLLTELLAMIVARKPGRPPQADKERLEELQALIHRNSNGKDAH